VDPNFRADVKASGTIADSAFWRRARCWPEVATTDRSANESVTIGDLPARTDGTRPVKGGLTVASAGARTATYQHNQTDLEFVR
jgi:hypothetical protein